MKFIAYLHQKGRYSSFIHVMNSDIDVPGQHSFVVTCDWEVVATLLKGNCHFNKPFVI